MIIDSYLNMENFISNKQFLKIFHIIEKHGGVLRFVGGAVRDAIAGMQSYDYDLATDLSPEELLEICELEGIKTVPIGIKYGTLGVFIGDKMLEITSLRKDIKTDGRHAEVEFTDDWIADASRRDLTINAVYADEKGNVFDYFNGIKDLKNGIVRFIGSPEQRIPEDYLRIVRFFRFYSKFGKTEIDKNALRVCVENKEHLKQISIERISVELIKLAVTPNFAKTLKIMYDNGILDYILPPSDNLENLQHLIDIETENNIEPVALRRFFVLYNPNVDFAHSLSDRMHLSRKQKEKLQHWAKIQCSVSDFENDKFLAEIMYRYGKEFCRDKALLTYAMEFGDKQNISNVMKKIDDMNIPVFPLTGQDILQIVNTKSKCIGDIIQALENYWLGNGCTSSKEELINVAKLMFNSLTNNNHCQ